MRGLLPFLHQLRCHPCLTLAAGLPTVHSRRQIWHPTLVIRLAGALKMCSELNVSSSTVLATLLWSFYILRTRNERGWWVHNPCQGRLKQTTTVHKATCEACISSNATIWTRGACCMPSISCRGRTAICFSPALLHIETMLGSSTAALSRWYVQGGWCLRTKSMGVFGLSVHPSTHAVGALRFNENHSLTIKYYYYDNNTAILKR
jgi:hypothetical protein